LLRFAAARNYGRIFRRGGSLSRQLEKFVQFERFEAAADKVSSASPVSVYVLDDNMS
jgi:hypothetical protein